jgi:hypothetical protein
MNGPTMVNFFLAWKTSRAGLSADCSLAVDYDQLRRKCLQTDFKFLSKAFQRGNLEGS